MTPRIQTAIGTGLAVMAAALFLAVLWRDETVRADAQGDDSVAQEYASPLSYCFRPTVRGSMCFASRARKCAC